MDEKIENAGILGISVIHVLELVLQLTEERGGGTHVAW